MPPQTLKQQIEHYEREISELNRKLLALQYAGAAIASSLDTEHILNSLCREMINLLEAEGCAISEWNPVKNTVSTMAEWGPNDWWEEDTSPRTYSLTDYPLTKQVLLERRSVQLTVSQLDDDPIELAYMRKINIKTLLMLPMEHQDRTVGLVEVMDSRTERVFTPDEIAWVQFLANQAANAIDNARLYDQAQRELAERMQMQKELQRVAAASQAMLAAIPDMMFYLDSNGKILDYKMMDSSHFPPGVFGEMAIGKNLREMLPPDFVQLILHYVNATLTSGEIQAFEYQFSTQEGIQDFEVRLIACGGREVLTIIRNIADRKRAERALKRSEANLKAIFDNSMQAFLLLDNNYKIQAFNKTADKLAMIMWGISLKEGDSIYQFVPTEDFNQVRQYLEKVSSGKSVIVEQQIRLGDKDNWFEFHFAPVYADDNQVIGICLSTIDIDKRKKTADALVEKEARLIAEMQSVLAITRALVKEININNLLGFILTQAEHLTNAEGAAVLLLSEDGQWLEVAPPDEAWRQMKAGLRLLAEGSLAELAIASQRVQVSNWVQDDPRTASIQALLHSVKLHSILCAPLVVKDRCLGVLLVWNKRRQLFTESDIRLMSLFADQAALAWYNAQLHSQNRKLAIEQERHRLARELHDSVTQSLYSIGMAAQASLRLLEHDSIDDARAPMQLIQKLSQNALAEMRERLYDLRPAALADKGLVEVLSQYCETLMKQHPLEIEFAVPVAPTLSLYQQESLYYLAREALWNVIKYAKTGRVRLELKQTGHHTVLAIADEGAGFDPSIFESLETMGLRNMKERVKLLGGTFELETEAGRGTRIWVRIPKQLPEIN